MDGAKMLVMLIMCNVVLNLGLLTINSPQKSLNDGVSLFVTYGFSSGNVALKSNIQNNLPTSTNQGINVNPLVVIIDGLGMVFNILLIIFSIIGVPVMIFGFLPPIMAVIFCVPSIIMILLMYLAFIRGVQW